jgi:hypothetical protein
MRAPNKYPTSSRNAGLWQPVMDKAIEFLDANPLASCADAARFCHVSQAALGKRLGNLYDFKARRSGRGDANRVKVLSRKVGEGTDDNIDALVKVMVRIERKLDRLVELWEPIMPVPNAQPTLL